VELDAVGRAEESADPSGETLRDLGLLICAHHWMGSEEQEQRDGSIGEARVVLRDMNTLRIKRDPRGKGNRNERQPTKGLENSAPEVEAKENQTRND